MDRYLSISEIANMFDLSRQTLHFYDKKNLFVPEYRDEKTGYRKYEFQQIFNLALICYLRKIGFSIEKIKIFMDLENVDTNVDHLKNQSEMLRAKSKEILNIDRMIQRKIEFVENKHENKYKDIELKNIEVKKYDKRAYVGLGKEEDLYSNEMFYYFPTIAFYNYNSEEEVYDDTLFGAYIELKSKIDKYKDEIEFIDEKSFLCFYHKGPYKKNYR